MLVPCGHSDNGKAAETYQRMSILLAKNGMAALCYDPIGQGERVQLLDGAGKPAVKGSTTEHTLLGIGALLVGRSAAGYRVWDGIRSLDYLASRPEIDPKRLGCTGNSGGGTLTAYLMALDDRIVAAAPSCYITSLERLFATIGPQDAEQNITGQVAFGMEHADYVTMRAPRPTLLSVGTRDFFDIQGSWDTFREVKRIYCTLGHRRAGRPVRVGRAARVHAASARGVPCAGCAAGCSARTTRRSRPTSRSPPTRTCNAPRRARCSTAFQGKSVFDLNAERAAELDRAGGASSGTAEALPGRGPQAARASRGRRPGHRPAGARRSARDGYTIDALGVRDGAGRPGPRAPLPGRAGGERPLVVYVGADRALAAPGGPIEARVKAGENVALVEPRGMGEGSPEAKPAAVRPATSARRSWRST